jgi:hypothetical protein
MPATKPFLGVDASRCNHDTVDGETVILDATTGVLTLLVGVGPSVWERLVVGTDRGALLDAVADAYGADAVDDAATFVDELIAAGLVVEVDEVASVPDPTPWPETYVAPRIERYEDIADIMTMDPIHEVDKTLGWPRPLTDPANDSV